MSEQDKARERARFLIAWADGKTLQCKSHFGGVWDDWDYDEPPTMKKPSEWRIKPEPRKMWERVFPNGSNEQTTDPDMLARWKAAGYSVTEWQEVVQ